MPTSFIKPAFENEDVSKSASVSPLGTDWLKMASGSLTTKLERFLADRLDTPFLAIDLEVVRSQFLLLQREFPNAAIHYAVKANPAREIIQVLAALGSRFDIASRYELDLCLSLGVPAAWISFGNTVKKSVD
ncbi:MAG: hypothetical protein KC643_01470, partial [Nitrospira sp.]|nr:hypothetical protein [Nitrospira sp.]